MSGSDDSLIPGVRWLAAFAGWLYCPREKCGIQVLSQDLFCGRCGMKLDRWVVHRSSVETNEKWISTVRLMETNPRAWMKRMLDNAAVRLQLTRLEAAQRPTDRAGAQLKGIQQQQEPINNDPMLGAYEQQQCSWGFGLGRAPGFGSLCEHLIGLDRRS